MKKNLADKVYEMIKSDIINLEYGINEMLSEQMMATKYEVSKTTAREALSKLCQDGYLVKYPSKGYFIKDMNLKEYEETLQLRMFIEVGVVKTVIDKCDDEEIMSLYDVVNQKSATHENFHELNRSFHYEMAKLTKNKRLTEVLYDLVCSISRPWSYINFGKSADELQGFHKLIVDALLKRDKEEAVRLIEADITPTTGVAKGQFKLLL